MGLTHLKAHGDNSVCIHDTSRTRTHILELLYILIIIFYCRHCLNMPWKFQTFNLREGGSVVLF